jgi:hypothetical protein
MRIGIDIDGCLAEFNGAFLKLLEKLHGKDLKIPDGDWPTMWDWPHSPELAEQGLTRKTISKAWDEVCKPGSTFWLNLAPMPEVYQVGLKLALLEAGGHDIYFITTRPGHKAKQQSADWLQRYMPIDPTVLVSSEKGLCASGLELTHFIDDKPDNLRDVLRARGTKCKCYLLKRPWNRDEDISYMIETDSVTSFLEQISKETT